MVHSRAQATSGPGGSVHRAGSLPPPLLFLLRVPYLGAPFDGSPLYLVLLSDVLGRTQVFNTRATLAVPPAITTVILLLGFILQYY